MIQRCKPHYDFRKSTNMDELLLYDYMGSSEFEGNSLFKSLKNIRSNIGNYQYTTFFVDKKIIMVFHDKKLSIGLIHHYLYSLKDGLKNLKEPSHFDKFIENNKHFDTNIWWDLDNDIIFWDNSIKGFNNKFNELIPGQKIIPKKTILQKIKKYLKIGN